MTRVVNRPQVVGGGVVLAPAALTSEEIAAEQAWSADALKPENQRKLEIQGIEAELARMEALAAHTNSSLGTLNGITIPGRRTPEGMPAVEQADPWMAMLQVASGDDAASEPSPTWIGDGPSVRLGAGVQE